MIYLLLLMAGRPDFSARTAFDEFREACIVGGGYIAKDIGRLGDGVHYVCIVNGRVAGRFDRGGWTFAK